MTQQFFFFDYIHLHLLKFNFYYTPIEPSLQPHHWSYHYFFIIYFYFKIFDNIKYIYIDFTNSS